MADPILALWALVYVALHLRLHSSIGEQVTIDVFEAVGVFC
jgi:hypothetical protein